MLKVQDIHPKDTINTLSCSLCRVLVQLYWVLLALVGVVAVLEKRRPTQPPQEEQQPAALDPCLKAKPFKRVLSLLGIEQQGKELGKKKY